MPINPNSVPSSPMNHVFVDFENVHHVDLAVIGAKAVSLTLLVGAKQTKLDAAMVEKLMEHSASVQMIRMTSSRKNAVDFALAYHLGRTASTDPTAYFHIISKDTGFDPLIDHMRQRNIRVRRHDDCTTLTFSGPPKPPPSPPQPPLDRALAHLRKNTTNRPKRKKTLVSHLRALCGSGASEKDALTLIEKLRKAGHLKIGDKDAVTYSV